MAEWSVILPRVPPVPVPNTEVNAPQRRWYCTRNCVGPSTSLGCLQRKVTLRKQRGLFRFGTDICNKSASPLLWRTWKKASELYSSPGEIPQCQEVAPEAEDMCIICERELWGEHRALEREFFKSCKTCKKF